MLLLEKQNFGVIKISVLEWKWLHYHVVRILKKYALAGSCEFARTSLPPSTSLVFILQPIGGRGWDKSYF